MNPHGPLLRDILMHRMCSTWQLLQASVDQLLETGASLWMCGNEHISSSVYGQGPTNMLGPALPVATAAAMV